ncbi:MAG: sulfotransferase [Cyclobacteriaceae bacterium]
MNVHSYLKTIYIIYRKKLCAYLSPIKHRSYTRFVIVSHPRSGSTLLHTLLNAHPQIHSRGEILQPYINSDIHIDASKLYEHIFRPMSTNIRAVGFKFFFKYFKAPTGKAVVEELCQDKDVRIILLKRKNLLRAIISLEIARKTRKFSSIKDSELRAKRLKSITLNPALCLATLQQMELEQKQLIKYFNKKKCLELTYEALVSNQNKTVEVILQHLGLKHRNLFSLLKRQNPEPLDQLVINYDELKKALEGTKWYSMLYD